MSMHLKLKALRDIVLCHVPKSMLLFKLAVITVHTLNTVEHRNVVVCQVLVMLEKYYLNILSLQLKDCDTMIMLIFLVMFLLL